MNYRGSQASNTQKPNDTNQRNNDISKKSRKGRE